MLLLGQLSVPQRPFISPIDPVHRLISPPQLPPPPIYMYKQTRTNLPPPTMYTHLSHQPHTALQSIHTSCAGVAVNAAEYGGGASSPPSPCPDTDDADADEGVRGGAVAATTGSVARTGTPT